MLNLKLVDNTAEFAGNDGTVSVHRFDLEFEDGMPLCRSDDGPVSERLYCFRVAGVAHHELAAQSAALAPASRVLLVRERSNAYDSNAIRVVGEDKQSRGYVPRAAAASLSGLMEELGVSVVPGIVTKTFAARGKRNAIEVLCGIEIDIAMTGTVHTEDDAPPPKGDDLWHLKGEPKAAETPESSNTNT